MAGQKKVKIKGLRPLTSRGRLDYILKRKCLCLGDHPVSWTIGLGGSFRGFLVPLLSHTDAVSERVDEVFGLLSILVDCGYGYVPPGALTALKDSVSTSLLIGANEDSLAMDRFDMAIPLRRANEGYRSYFMWDTESHDWRLRQFQTIQNLHIPGRNIMLIAYDPHCNCRNMHS